MRVAKKLLQIQTARRDPSAAWQERSAKVAAYRPLPRQPARFGIWPLAFIVGGLLLPSWSMLSGAPAIIMMAGLLCAIGIWHALTDDALFKGLTFTSIFALVYAFVFSARAIYIAIKRDFEILEILGVQGDLDEVKQAMGYAVVGLLAFSAGAYGLRARAVAAAARASFGWGAKIGAANVTAAFVYTQGALTLVLLPLALKGDRNLLLGYSESAYIYLLPTVVHGFNLYFFTHACLQWRESRTPMALALLAMCSSMVVLHAYLLHNLSPFRGYYLVGVFSCGLVGVRIVVRHVSVWAVVALFAFYPIFKAIGTDRSMTNREVIQDVLMHPLAAYTDEGMEAAFGSSTDINMLDTFVASLKWDHRFRGYFLSYLYPLVHWVPRAWWPTKPPYGVLSDGGYLYSEKLARDIPYSPGIIGFFNDDGGKAYMLFMMAVLGYFIRIWEIAATTVRSLEMRHATWGAFALCALVTVRYLPYQVFYQFLVLFVPCWICDSSLVKRFKG